MGGNLLRQPAYKNVPHEVIGRLDGANKIHDEGLSIGDNSQNVELKGLTPEDVRATLGGIVNGEVADEGQD